MTWFGDDPWAGDPDAKHLPDPSDWNEEPAEVRCPSCGRMVFEDTPKCPHCGDWINAASDTEHRSRTFIWPIAIAVLIALVLIWIL